MAVVEKFLGKRVTIPEDRRYYAKQGLWAKAEEKEVFFGMTEPALVLAGGANSLDWIAGEGQTVQAGESVAFMITGKIFYIDTPVGGTIAFNPAVKGDPARISADPYGEGWIFKIKPEGNPESAVSGLAEWPGYMESLRETEGFKNPEGVVGGVSGMCKAVYGGIRAQKF